MKSTSNLSKLRTYNKKERIIPIDDPITEEYYCSNCGHNKELHTKEKDSRDRNGVRKPCIAKGCNCKSTFS